MNKILQGLIPFALALSACSGGEKPCAGSKCSDAGMTPTDQGSAPADVSSADTAPDVAADAALDMTAMPDVADVATQPDLSVDLGADMPVIPPAPEPATRFSFDIPFTPLGAAGLGNGILVVGNTPNNFELNEDREAVALHTDADSNVVWSARFGGRANEQFFSAAQRGASTVAAGLTRSYSVTAALNNDALLVRADATGLGEAFNWGTADDELLFGLYDGGAVAEWIGVGEYTTDKNSVGSLRVRDAFIVAFDANLQPLWASAFDTGEDSYLTSAVVIGDTVYVVGTTGTRGPGTIRHSLVAAVTQTQVRWALSSPVTSNAVGATVVGQQIAVAGNMFDGSGTPTLVRFETDGTYAGERFVLPGALVGTRLWVSDNGTEIFAGGMGQRIPFLMRLNPGAEPDLLTFTDFVGAVTYLPAPIASTAAGAHVFYERADQTVLGIPFTDVPDAGGCSAGMSKVTVMPIPADLFEPIVLTRTDLTLTGGRISTPRSSSIAGVAETPAVCDLPG